MSDEVERPPRVPTPRSPVGPTHDYVSPQIERLGTLAELTRGGDVGLPDNIGNAGEEGSL